MVPVDILSVQSSLSQLIKTNHSSLIHEQVEGRDCTGRGSRLNRQGGHDCTGTVVVLPDILADARFSQTLESSHKREGRLLDTQSPVIISCSFAGLLLQPPPVLTFSDSHFYNCSAERGGLVVLQQFRSTRLTPLLSFS
jgi:hypothetical protein